ncbi:hypothetical protein KCG44_12430 [Pacificimonas sp. WHA3]|uniref:Uncharacterized protein n=1 Tax=Pacificimonas pallii TaxID=2827236 RepID=A0ABS6SGT0_9SPHN|nr:3-keto-5-aminohexanoate cleavage protein [Pacificimonas pallii]MBV7257590.1 hypothetical protein [Pacificimonas pallii]
MPTDVEQQLITMLSKERGLPADRIKPSSRLLDDLGMDGDDAVEFFIDVKETFGTDISLLEENWNRHFGPEGLSCWLGVIVVPVAFLTGMISAHFGLPNWATFIAALIAIVAGVWALNKIPSKNPHIPITVDELVEAVKAGAWLKSYN